MRKEKKACSCKYEKRGATLKFWSQRKCLKYLWVPIAGIAVDGKRT
jgi:hypothetical protein